jgi:hypothetical protein
MASLGTVVCQPIVGPNPSFPSQLGILGADWLTLSFLALLTSFFVLLLIYMLSYILRNQNLAIWCKFELFQILATATVSVFLIVWIIGMCEFKMDFLNDSSRGIDYTGKQMFDIINDYFDRMKHLGYAVFYLLMKVSKWITFFQKLTFFSNPLGLGAVDTPLDSFGNLQNVISVAASGFTTSFLLFEFQRRIIDYMAYACLYYFAPFGIFFRSFEPTRGVGGALLGLVLSFFLFYPIIIVFNDYMTKRSIDETANFVEKLNKASEPSQEQVAKNANENVQDLSFNTDNKNTIAQMNDDISAIVYFGLLKPIALYIIAAVILPVLNFIVLVEITRGMTKALGDEIDVSNLTRLI